MLENGILSRMDLSPRVSDAYRSFILLGFSIQSPSPSPLPSGYYYSCSTLSPSSRRGNKCWEGSCSAPMDITLQRPSSPNFTTARSVAGAPREVKRSEISVSAEVTAGPNPSQLMKPLGQYPEKD